MASLTEEDDVGEEEEVGEDERLLRREYEEVPSKRWRPEDRWSSMASSPRSEGEEEEEVGEDERDSSRRYMCEYEEIPSERWLEALSFRSSGASSFNSCHLNPSASTDGAPDPAGRIPSREISGLPSSPPRSGGHKGGAPASQGRKNKKTSGRPPLMSKLWGRKKKPPKMEPVVEDEMEPVVEDDFTEIHMGNLTKYSHNDIQVLHREKLQRDSCYDVYTGRRTTGEYVTVERYRERDGRLDYLKAELRATLLCRHPNTVKCKGWFRKNGDVHLVYKFLPDRLSSCLESNDVLLTWKARYKISTGLAHAILHLHEECGQCVLHGNINPEQVLLDTKFNVKLAGFEFAQLRDHAGGSKGFFAGTTLGYLDSDYVMTGVYTKATEVYSFGVILLQLATGLPTNPSTDKKTPRGSLFDWVLERYLHETPHKSLFDRVLERHLPNQLMDVVDNRLGSKFDQFEMERVLRTGLLCARPNSQLRPSISEAIVNLESGVPMSAILNVLYDYRHDRYLPSNLPGKKFSYQELGSATDDYRYDNIVWIGGNGVIYQGYVYNDKMQLVAIKMYKDPAFGKLFIEEIRTLGILKHKNIVQLIGWFRGYRKCLILYEFMANGNLFSYLCPASKSLPWKTRYRIALDLACAILYIHEEHEVCILHTNITSTNILLDENYTCKLTGFETATELGQDIDRAMHRTPCYMDPDVVHSGKFSKASDIYSFGLVILEIACGKTTIYVDEHGEKFYLYDEVLDLYNKGALLKAADERLNMQFDAQEMEGLLLLGLSCAQRNSRYRPSIMQVVQVFKLQIPLSDLCLDEPEQKS